MSPPHSLARPQIAHVNNAPPIGEVKARHRAHAESRKPAEVPHTVARSRSTHSPAAMSLVAMRPMPRPGIGRAETAGACVADMASGARGNVSAVGGEEARNENEILGQKNLETPRSGQLA